MPETNTGLVGSFVGAGTEAYHAASNLCVKITQQSLPHVQRVMSTRHAKVMAGGVLVSVAAIAVWKIYRRFFGSQKDLSSKNGDDWSSYVVLDETSKPDHTMGLPQPAVPIHKLPQKAQVRMSESPLRQADAENLCKTPASASDVDQDGMASRSEAVPNNYLTEWHKAHEAQAWNPEGELLLVSSVDPDMRVRRNQNGAMYTAGESWRSGQDMGQTVPQSQDNSLRNVSEGWCQCKTKDAADPGSSSSQMSCRPSQSDATHVTAIHRECCQHHVRPGERVPQSTCCHQPGYCHAQSVSSCSLQSASCSHMNLAHGNAKQETCGCKNHAACGEPKPPPCALHQSHNSNSHAQSRECCQRQVSLGSGEPSSSCRMLQHTCPNQLCDVPHRECCQHSVHSSPNACQHPAHKGSDKSEDLTSSASQGCCVHHSSSGDAMSIAPACWNPYLPYQPRHFNGGWYPGQTDCGQPYPGWNPNTAVANPSYGAPSAGWYGNHGDPVPQPPVCLIVGQTGLEAAVTPSPYRLLYSEIDNRITYRTVDYFEPHVVETAPSSRPSSVHSCPSLHGMHCPACPMSTMSDHPAPPGHSHGDGQVDPDAWSLDGTISGSASTISTLENGSSTSISGHGDGLDNIPPPFHKDPAAAVQRSAPSFVSYPSLFHQQTRLSQAHPLEQTASCHLRQAAPYRVEQRPIYDLRRPVAQELRSAVLLNPYHDRCHPHPVLYGHQPPPFPLPSMHGHRLVTQHDYASCQSVPLHRPTVNRKLAERPVV